VVGQQRSIFLRISRTIQLARARRGWVPATKDTQHNSGLLFEVATGKKRPSDRCLGRVAIAECTALPAQRKAVAMLRRRTLPPGSTSLARLQRICTESIGPESSANHVFDSRSLPGMGFTSDSSSDESRYTFCAHAVALANLAPVCSRMAILPYHHFSHPIPTKGDPR
jgi:hypothetical protein